MASNRLIFSGLGLALLLSAGVVLADTLADTLAGKVVGVSDGDTITVLDSDKRQHKIRVAGIDAVSGAKFPSKSGVDGFVAQYRKAVLLIFRYDLTGSALCCPQGFRRRDCIAIHRLASEARQDWATDGRRRARRSC